MTKVTLFNVKGEKIEDIKLNDENLYILTGNQLDKEFLLPIIVNYSIANNSFDTSMLGDDPYLTLKSMDEETHEQFVNGIKDNYSEEKVGLLEQMSILYIKGEYQKIGIDVDKIQMNYIIKSGIKMLALAFIIMAIAISTSYLLSRLASFFSKDLRSAVTNKVMTYSNTEFESFSTASLITRSTNDIQQIQMFIIMLLRIVLFAPIMGIGALTKVSGNEMGFIIVLAISIILILKEISLVLEVSESRVSQLHTKALAKMKKKLSMIDLIIYQSKIVYVVNYTK